MKKVCYWCSTYIGETDGNHGSEILHSMCDDCARRLRLDEKLPELLWAIVTLRGQNGSKAQNQTLGVLTTAQ